MKYLAAILALLGLTALGAGSPQPVPAADKANSRAADIVRLAVEETYRSGPYEVEIQSIEKIEGGVQVYARAWKNNQPLGFGDGSVEIERFRFFGTPTLVPDPQGDIVSEHTNERGTFTARYREDPRAALQQMLVQAIELSATTTAKLQPGKVGRTTDTFYPDADPESTSVDGRVTNDGCAVYATCQSASAGSTASPSTASCEFNNMQVGGTFRVARFFTLFDTSAIPDGDAISSATISIVAFDKADTNGYSARVITTTPASNTDLVTDDFDQVGTTAQASDIAISAITTGGGYTDFSLNATGISNISKTGVSKFGFRTTGDISASSPTGLNYVDCRTADVGATTEDPKLVVVHSTSFVPYRLY